MDLKGRTILVTGGGGFLGQHLVARLRRHGCTELAVPRKHECDGDAENERERRGAKRYLQGDE